MKPQLFLPLFLLFPLAAVAQDWRAEADARIEQHRKENVTLSVTLDGKPVAGATVTVKMLQNEFLFGSNIFVAQHLGMQSEQETADYLRRFEELLNFATQQFYWPYYEFHDGKPLYINSERIAKWCGERGIRAKGHPLVWNTRDPEWVKDMSMDELFQAQMERVTICVEMFRHKIDTWDVINEVTEWQRPDNQKNSPKLTELGKTMGDIELAKASFATARKANPNATLLINDYITDDRYAKVIEQLADDKGKPIYDVIGIQSHMHTDIWDNARIWEVCERFAKFKVPLHFTEMTILSTDADKNWWAQENNQSTPTTPEGEIKQAEHVERIYTMLFSHPSVEAITWWDFSDLHAWMNAPAGLIRKDMSPKPAYDVLKKLIKEKWATNVTLKTDGTGETTFRAFRGEYQFTVTLPDGKRHVVEPKKVQKGANSFEIVLK
ncbi:MAG: endo-1,4-beta-xylanase [Planctomycetaceae bacterium]|jgi:GH35 family endo-1,4-beta-xylanase|nr:endo-1,4-beta-xylanase [Planctomycetaceae bacterium]